MNPTPPDSAIAAMVLLTTISIGIVVLADWLAQWIR
jgi:hypothetical protein